VGGCGLTPIAKEKVYDFNDGRNFFLGLGGAPKQGWLSLAPFTVQLNAYNKIKSFTSSFNMDTAYEYYISPPGKRPPMPIEIPFPTFTNQAVCQRGTHYGIQTERYYQERENF